MESKQRVLSINTSLNLFALFAKIDSDKSGSLTITELDTWASTYLGGRRLNWQRIIMLWRQGEIQWNFKGRRPDGFEQIWTPGRRGFSGDPREVDGNMWAPYKYAGRMGNRSVSPARSARGGMKSANAGVQERVTFE